MQAKIFAFFSGKGFDALCLGTAIAYTARQAALLVADTPIEPMKLYMLSGADTREYPIIDAKEFERKSRENWKKALPNVLHYLDRYLEI